MRSVLGLSTLVLLILLLAPIPSFQQPGTTLYVNNTHPTCHGQSPCFRKIQDAVKEAGPGDNIQIQAGEYDELVLIKGKNNSAGATEADRIVIEADPTAPMGSVILGSSSQKCDKGDALQIESSKFITISGLTITGVGGQSIALAGGNKKNTAIHIERNRIFSNGTGKCLGGILIGAGNTDTLIINNLIYGNRQHGLVFRTGKGGSHSVVNNTIHGNGRNGVSIGKNQGVLLVNNLITGNGADPKSPAKDRFGIKRLASGKNGQPEQAQLLNNLICGNKRGELSGALLDSTDAGNLTPTGVEDRVPRVSPSPGCEVASNVYTNLNGLDGQPNTADDDFSLATTSPAIDKGADPRTLSLGVPNTILERDFSGEARRPRDGDLNGSVLFDMGALEKAGQCEPGATESCYTGPAGTQGVGQCKAGTQTCGANGTFGTCMGEMLPAPEIPNNGADEDCDGQDAKCTSGETVSCYTGPPGTEGVGQCKAGTKTCGAGGAFGACTGEMLPVSEIPGNNLDEDCDGIIVGCATPIAPDLKPIGDRTIPLGSSLTLPLRVAGSRCDSLNFSVAPLPLPDHATFNTATGLFTFTPAPEQVGTFALTFAAIDGSLTDSEAITITVQGPSPNGVTALTGRILDTNAFVQGQEAPVVGARVSLLGSSFSTTSGADGRFMLSGIPAGSQVLDINTATAQPAPQDGLPDAGSPYAGFREEIELIAQVTNVVERPFFLPRTAMESSTPVNPGNPTTVCNPRLDVCLMVPPHTAKKAGGTDFTGALSISEVPKALAPHALPENLEPGLLITIQPVGVCFANPVPITFPNIDHLPAGSETDIWSLDAGTGAFTVVGVGRVSADGQRVETVSGGVRCADRHMTLPPATNGTAENTEHNEESQGQGASCPLCGSGCKVPPQTGAFVLDPTLPSYRSLGVSHSVEFIYNSLSADPRPIIPFDTIITLAATVVVPPAVSYSVEFGGVRQGREIFVKTSDLAATLDGTIRNALQLDASTFPTGSYPYELRLTSNYDVSRVSSEITGQVLVNNELGSPFGVGWTMKGLQRLHLQPDQSVVLTEGDGSIRVFATSGAAGDFQSPPGDFSTLQQNPDTTFTRTLKNGSRLTFDAAGLHKATVDRNGNTTSYMYDVQGRLIQITDPKDLSTVLRYAGGLLSLVTDSAGRVTTFIHDTANNLTKVTYPDNSTETFSYDGHLLTGEINQRGFTTTHQYDFAGRFVHSILPDTSTRAVSASQLVGLVDPSGGLGTPTNPAPVYRPKQALGSFTDGNLNTTVLKTDSLGNITKQTDALGRTTVIERDPNGNPTRITRPNGTVTTMTYDARGNLLTSTELGIPGQPDPAFPAATTFTYEPTFNQVKTIKDPKENVTTINYDPKGNPIEIIDTKGTHTLLRYDDPRCLGQLTSVTSAAGKPEESTTAFEYDPTTCNLVKTTDPLGNMTTLEYDTAGNVVRSTDAEGRVTRFQYDVMNHLTKVIDATNRASNPACGTAGVTCYDYDPRENLIRVMDARGKETSFEYDALDRLVRTIDPLGKVGTFSYDGNSNLASTTDRKIQTINFEYNAVNQLLRKVLPGNLETFFRYDVAGNLKVVEAPSSEVGMVYDPLGRLQSTETIIFEDTSNGPPVTITQPTTIGPTDRQFDGTALTIAGAPVVIDGQHTFAGLILKNGAVVSHSAATATGTSQLDLRVGGTVAIDSTSRIDVTGKGFLGGLRGENASSSVGRTLGNTTTGGSEISAGGSYGGLGGLRVDAASIPNGVYGDFHRPLEPGSGGGAVPCLGGTCMGGNGGGMARITATTIALSGRIRADGGQADLSGGGGSGGAIFITTSSLQGAGSITADGGGGANGGGGGGGRVAVIYDNLTGFDPDRISAASGLGENLGRHGGAGTIFLQSTTQTNGDLIVDNRRLNVVTGLTPLRAIRPGTSTALAANVLTNTATTFRTPDPTTGEIGLIGLELNPNTAQNQTFTVVGNTGTTLTTDSADGDMTSVASSGNSYIGVYTFDNLTVRNGANMTTVDNCVVLGTLTVTGGSANCNNLTQSASLSTNNLIVQAPARTKPGMRLANFSGGPLTLSLSHEGRGDSQTNSTIQNPQSPIHNLQSAPAFRIRHSAIEAGAVDPSYTYDKNGNRLTMTDPTGTTTYTYDELNRLTSLTNPSSQTIEFDYDALSHRTQTTFPNGTTASFAYDPASQLLSLVNKLGATTLSSFEYTYDKVGNRKMLDQQCSAITVASPLSYMYDNLNRLIEAIRPLPANPLETFNYDPVGNRLRRDGQTTDAIFDAANRLREDQRFCYEYDDNGNLTKKTVKVGNACTGDVTMYTYDAENRLIRIDLPGGGIAKYRYDGLGRRIEKSVNGEVTRYVYDNEDILFETDAAGSILARYTHGPGIDEPLIMERGSQRFFYHTDGLGSITELTDSTGAVAQAYVYDSFGQIVQQAGTLPNLYTYTGREFDPESGLYYYRARYYDAGVGRFLQEDLWKPIKGMNLYGYVRNNPVNRTDPSGLVCLLVGPGPFDVECDKKEEAKAAAEAFRARMLSQGFTVQVVPHPPHKQGRKLPHYHVKDGAEFEYGGVYYNHFYYSEEEEEEKQEESVCVSNPSGPHLRGPIEPPFVVPSPLPILW